MLTDYHTHLRPDDLSATARDYFTEENLSRYLEVAAEKGVEELGFSEHIYRFKEALTIWQHPFWQESAVDELAQYCQFIAEMNDKGHPIKLGIEVDWIAGREQALAELIDSYPWDYVIGSVHFVGDQAFDHQGFDIWRSGAGAEEIWQRYFEALGQAAASGLFDILAHPDLVKIWGRRPDGDLRRYYELAIDRIAAADLAVEVSTAGLRKPVAEIYPAREFLQMCLDVGKPLSLSSDAHVPEDIGYGYDQALALIGELQVSEIAVFTARRRTIYSLHDQ